MTTEPLVPVRVCFDADWLVVASTVRIGSGLRMVDHVVFERPVSDDVLVDAVTAALRAEVPDEFEGADEASWAPVLEVFDVSELDSLAFCWVRSQNGYVWVTSMKADGDRGYPEVAPRDDDDGSLVRLGDEVWLGYELRRSLETSLNAAGERFGARGGLFEVAPANGGSRPVRLLVGAEPTSIVDSGTVAAPLRFELGGRGESLTSAQIDDEAFGGLLDELARLGLWASLDSVEAGLSRESNLKHRSWRWGELDSSARVALNLDSMLEDDLEQSLVGRIREPWAALGLDLVAEHRTGADHLDMSFQGFRAWINGEPVSYAPTIDTMFRPLALINWLADRAGVDHRMYLSGVFHGWNADSPGFDFEAAYLLSRPVAELIQSTPLLGASQRLVSVETLSGHVCDWPVR